MVFQDVAELFRCRYSAVVVALLFASVATAQEVTESPPVKSEEPPSWQQTPSQSLSVLAPAPAPLPGAPTETPFQWGPVSLRPHPLYRFLYGDGIQANPGQHEKTAINEISPGMLLGLGDHWTVDYTPTLTYYSSSQFRDTTAHNVIMTGTLAYENWLFGLSQSYRHSDEPLVQTGSQTTEDSYLTAVNAACQLSRQLSLELNVNQNFTFPNNLTESREWSTLDWLSYQFWPRFSAGLGLGCGYVDVNVGDDAIYGQLQGRIVWQATDKINLRISGGAEDRHFFGGGDSDLVNPVFGVAIQYLPTEATTITLAANGTVDTSYYTNQVTETESVTATVNQRLLKRVYLTVTGGYQRTSYTSTTSGVAAGRDDDYYTFNARLSTAFLKRGTIAATYQYSDNASNQSGYGYSSNQVGVEVGYRY